MTLLFSVLAAAAAAHEQKEAVTTVLFNERTGNVEVMHRFLLHDVEHASKKLFGAQADLLKTPGDREKFADYVFETFSLQDESGTPITLTAVGSEIESRFLWVYAEAPINKDWRGVNLKHGALIDLWPDQANLINVERGGVTRSAVLSGGQREVLISFDD
ncbi:MAG: DUF6702 family protein [Pseudomonadota bacterium]